MVCRMRKLNSEGLTQPRSEEQGGKKEGGSAMIEGIRPLKLTGVAEAKILSIPRRMSIYI